MRGKPDSLEPLLYYDRLKSMKVNIHSTETSCTHSMERHDIQFIVTDPAESPFVADGIDIR